MRNLPVVPTFVSGSGVLRKKVSSRGPVYPADRVIGGTIGWFVQILSTP
jgi:hypothetical protein